MKYIKKGRADNSKHLVLFQKGQSGNPSGRPKGAVGLAARCREWADKYGLDYLFSVVADDGEGTKLRIAAAEYLIDRGYGKSPQSLTIEGNISLENIIFGTGIETDEKQ